MLSAALVLSSSASAEEASVAPSFPPASTSAPEPRPIPPLLVGGPVLLGSTYLATIAITAGIAKPSDVGRATGYAAIPLAGPWIMLGSNLPTRVYATSLVVSGIGQAGGLALTIAGLAARREARPPAIALGAVRMTLVPSAGGAAAIGTF